VNIIENNLAARHDLLRRLVAALVAAAAIINSSLRPSVSGGGA